MSNRSVRRRLQILAAIALATALASGSLVGWHYVQSGQLASLKEEDRKPSPDGRRDAVVVMSDTDPLGMPREMVAIVPKGRAASARRVAIDVYGPGDEKGLLAIGTRWLANDVLELRLKSGQVLSYNPTWPNGDGTSTAVRLVHGPDVTGYVLGGP